MSGIEYLDKRLYRWAESSLSVHYLQTDKDTIIDFNIAEVGRFYPGPDPYKNYYYFGPCQIDGKIDGKKLLYLKLRSMK